MTRTTRTTTRTTRTTTRTTRTTTRTTRTTTRTTRTTTRTTYCYQDSEVINVHLLSSWLSKVKLSLFYNLLEF